MKAHPLPFNSKKKKLWKNEGAPPPLEQSKNKLKQHTFPPSTIKTNLQKLQTVKKNNKK
jgi:hypothetical protein